MGRVRRTTGCVAALFVFGALWTSAAHALTVDAPDGTEDAAITVEISGTAASSASLYVYAGKASGFAECALTASSQEVTSGSPRLSETVGPGTFDTSFDFQPKGPGKVKVCAYLATDKSSLPLDYLSGSFVVASGKAYTPKLLSPGAGALSYERFPAFIWEKGPGKDMMRVYRGSRPIAQVKAPTGYRNGFSLVRRPGRWKARLSRRVAYGTYSWTVTRRDPRVGTERTTRHRGFRVGPSPLRHLAVRLRTREYDSIKRPGVSKVLIRSAPYARVRVRLTNAGRTVAFRQFLENRFNPRTRMSFSWRCSRTGTFKLKVLARDRYGHHRVKTVRWNVSASRCAAMKREKEAKEKAKDEAQNGSCTPGYSPCLAPASDYDCAGGSGDGPEYVSGPVYVSGDDPYGLDSDGDGVACE